MAFQVPANPENVAFQSAQEAEEILWRELQSLGWTNRADVRVTPATNYTGGKWGEIPNEYDVRITHPYAVEDQSYYARVKAAPNETVLKREAEQFKHYTGDTKDVGFKGFMHLKRAESPYYTGVQSFTRRIAAGLTKSISDKKAYPNDPNITWQNAVREYDDVEHMAGSKANMPGESPDKPIPMANRIPGSGVAHDPNVSPENVRFASYTYNVPNISPEGKFDESVQAVHRQILEKAAVGLRGGVGGAEQMAANPWLRLIGGGIWRPEEMKTGGRLVSGLAGGSMRVDPESGLAALDVLAETFLKHTYSVGRRPVADLSYISKGRMRPVPEEFLTSPSLTIRQGETSSVGLAVRSLTAVTPQTLPWQSGQGQVNLPTDLQRFLQQEKGSLVASTKASRRLNMEGITSVTDLTSLPFQLNQNLITGKMLSQGSQRPVSVLRADTSGIDANTPQGREQKKLLNQLIKQWSITPGSQMEQVTGYKLQYPQQWEEQMTKEQLAGHFAKLEAKGFTEFQPIAGNQPVLSVGMTSATALGPKGYPSKMQYDLPLRGVTPQLTRASGDPYRYDVLQEAKHLESVVFSGLRAMPEEQIPQLLATIFKGNTQMTNLVDTASGLLSAGKPLSLMDIGSGIFGTGEETLLAVSEAIRNYGDQDELIRRFGMGYITGEVPVSQYTPASWKYLRESVVSNLTMTPSSVEDLASMGYEDESQPRVLTQREAMRQWREVYSKRAQYDPTRKLYTHFAEQEFFAAPKLQTFHMETVGVGSTQGEYELGLEAQGFDKIRQWFGKYKDRLFPESPARWGSRQITRGWMATQYGAPVEKGMTATVTPQRAQEVLNLVQMMSSQQGADTTRIQGLEDYEKAFRQVFGYGETKEEPLFFFPSSKTTIAGAGAFGTQESYLRELTDSGALVEETQSHVSTRWMKAITGLLRSEVAQTPDLEARWTAQNLASKYIDSEQLRKRSGGTFVRYGGSSLLTGKQVGWSPRGLWRNYLMGGGAMGDPLERAQYLQVLRKVPTLGVRSPNPNIGTKGMPGSVFLMENVLPYGGNQWASAMRSMKTAGVEPYDVYLSSMSRMQQGDVDLDPGMFVPLMFRMQGEGKGQRARWVGYTEEEGDLGEWMRQITSQLSPEQQQTTFNRIFGANAVNFDPWGSRMREAIRYTMGDDATKSLLDKRLVLDSQNVQKEIERFNRVKTKEMGKQYNSLLRRIRVAATALGVPSESLVTASDLGIEPYQESIDLDIPDQTWSALMQTSGFFIDDGNRLEWGWGGAGENKDFGMGMKLTWSPTRDVSSLASDVARIMAGSKNPNAEFIASLTMNMPSRFMSGGGRRGDEEMNRLIATRRERITGALEKSFQVGKPGSVDRLAAINKTVEGLKQQGLIGANSIAVNALMTRALEYAKRGTTGWDAISKSINDLGGLQIDGERLSAAEFEKKYQPQSTLYDWQRHTKGVSSYKDVLNIAETVMAAEQGGWIDTAYMREFMDQWGSLAGLNREGQLEMTDPYTGKPTIIRTQEDIAELRATQAKGRAEMFDEWMHGGTGGIRRLSFSSLGSQAEIARTGDVFEDMYNQSLTGAMMHGFRNPIFATEGVGLNITAPQQLSRFYKTGGGATRQGDIVEEAYAEVQRGRLGVHIGQPRNPRTGEVDFNRVPRYSVQGKSGTRYDIAGVPDFLKFERGAKPGQYKVQVADVKNLYSQRGNPRDQVIKEVRENPAYATQVPGYQTMFADLPWLRSDEEGAKNAREMVFSALEKAGDTEGAEIFREMLEEGTSAEVSGLYAVSRYKAGTKMTGGRFGTKQSISRGLDDILSGALSSRSGGGMVRVDMPTISTSDVPTMQADIAGKAEQAQTMARELSLQGALYQSRQIKKFIMSNSDLIEQYGPQEITEGEEEAFRFWTTKKQRQGETYFTQRNPLDIRKDISAENLYKLKQATDINVAMMSGGTGVDLKQTIGTGVQQKTLEELAEPAAQKERSAKKIGKQFKKDIRRIEAGGLADAESIQRLVLALETLQGHGNLLMGGKGRRTGYTAGQAREFYRMSTKPTFEEYVGKFTGEEGALTWEKGWVSKEFDKLPQYLSEIEGIDVGTRNLVSRMPANEALSYLSTQFRERGLNFSKALKGHEGIQSLMGGLGLVETFVTQSFKDWSKLETGDDPTALAMRAMFMGDEKAATAIQQSHPGAMPYLGHMRENVLAAQGLQKSQTTGAAPALREFGDIAKAYLNNMESTTQAMKKQTDALVKGKEGYQSLTELIDGVSESSTKLAEKLAPLEQKLYKQGFSQWEDASALRREMTRGKGYTSAAGVSFKSIQAKGAVLTADELEMIYEAADERDLLGGIKKYAAATQDVAGTQYDMARVARGKQPVGGGAGGFGGLGRLGRVALGGFGMMYLQNIWGMMTGGGGVGQAEYLQQQQMITQGVGQYYGGVPGYVSGQQQIALAQAPYGGAGLEQMQRMQARAWETGRGATLMGAGQAAVAAFGAGTWMGSMIGAPWLGLVGAPVAAVGSMALQAYGAKSEPEISGVGMASRLWSGEMTMEQLAGYTAAAPTAQAAAQFSALMGERFQEGGMNLFQTGFPGQVSALIDKYFGPLIRGTTLTGEMDSQLAGWLENPEAVEITNRIANLRAERERAEKAGEDVNYEQIMRAYGFTDADIQRYQGYIMSARGEEFEGRVPFEGIVGAQMMETRYGMALTGGIGGQFETLGLALSQGAAWPQLAQQMAGGQNISRAEREREIAELIKEWSDNPPSEQETAALMEGAERFAGLGQGAPDLRGRAKREFIDRLKELTPRQYSLFQAESSLSRQRRVLGMSFRAPNIFQYQEMTPEELMQRERDLMSQQARFGQQQSIYTGLTQLGIAEPSMEMYEMMTPVQLALNQQQISGAFGVGQQLELAGADRDWAQAFAQMLAELQGREGQSTLGLLTGNRQEWARTALENPELMARIPALLPGMGNQMIDPLFMGMTDIREEASGMQRMTGMPWGTSSLAMPGISSASMATRIWGDWQGRFGGAGQGLVESLIGGGTFGGQLYQMERQAAHTQAMSGIQMQQIALNRSFQTGVGIGGYSGIINPQTGQPFGFETGRFNVNVQGIGGFRTQGGGLWGIQDAMRGLGYMQQEWQFGRQREQLDINDRYWQQNFNINQRQSMMQRGWAREDWAFQDQQRALQWGWRQEDFQEESRFMTGRDRRLAERQMARETIMYGMEGEQIDKQRERQEDLWQIEDERFQIQEQQHKEMLRFQEEGITMQERFFEERKRLEEEQFKLSRAYQIKQMELSEQQAAASAAYAAEQAEMARIMAELTQFSQEATAEGNLFNEDTILAMAEAIEEFNPVFAEAMRNFVEAKKKLQGSGGGGGGDSENDLFLEEEEGDKNGHKYFQHGGRMLAGDVGFVGEAGPEKFKPYFTGDIVPSYKTNPWETSMVDPTSRMSQQQFIQLILNLGGEHFREYIVQTVDAEIDV